MPCRRQVDCKKRSDTRLHIRQKKIQPIEEFATARFRRSIDRASTRTGAGVWLDFLREGFVSLNEVLQVSHADL